jgi:hypothetical protein
MSNVRDLPLVLRRAQQAFAQRVQHAGSGLAQAVAESREQAHHIDAILLVDKSYDIVSRSVENQRRLAKILLASGELASRSLAEQRAYQRRVLERARSSGARMSAARGSTPRQRTFQVPFRAATTGVKIAAEVAQENFVDACETVARQRALANTMAGQHIDAPPAVVGPSPPNPPLVSVPAPAGLGTTQAESGAVDYEVWKKPALVSEARSRGLATSGTVRDLRARLSAPHS